MSEMMGYNPGALGNLREAMRRSANELATIRVTDSEAQPAMRVVAASLDLIRNTWLARIDTLLTCGVLTGYMPTTIPITDLQHGALYVLEHEAGWRISTDPLAELPAQFTVLDAKALAWQLANGPQDKAFSNDELLLLQYRLRLVASRPALVDAFLNNMTEASWANLCNGLGRSHIVAVNDSFMYGTDAVDTTAIEAVFASLGEVLVADRKQHPQTDPVGLIDAMEPYSAALLVRNLDLTADELAGVSVRLVTRATQEASELSEWDYHVPGTADILMSAMMGVLGAPTIYVAALENDPELLFGASSDPSQLGRFLVAATDPRLVTDATTTFNKLLEFTTGEQVYSLKTFDDPQAYGATLCDVLIPWLPRFAGAGGAQSDEVITANAMFLLAAFSNGDALDRLIAQRDNVTNLLGMTESVRVYAGVIGLLQAVIRQATIAEAVEAQEAKDSTWMWINAGLIFNPYYGKTVSVATVGVDAVAGEASDGAAASVEYQTLLNQEYQSVLVTAAVVNATFQKMRAHQDPDESSPPPPWPNDKAENPLADYSNRFQQWLVDSGLEDESTGEKTGEGAELDQIKNLMTAEQEVWRATIDNAAAKVNALG